MLQYSRCSWNPFTDLDTNRNLDSSTDLDSKFYKPVPLGLDIYTKWIPGLPSSHITVHSDPPSLYSDLSFLRTAVL